MKRVKGYLRDIIRSYIHEFSLAIHDPGIVLFFAFLPLVYPVIYSLIYNPELVKEVPMVVVDNDRTPESRKLTRMLDAADQIWVIGYASDLNEARHVMGMKKCYSILEIPEGFQRKIGTTETAPAVIYSDMTLLLRYRGTVVAATEVMQAMGAELLERKVDEIVPLAGTVVSGDLLPIENVSMGNVESGFDTFIMPGVIVLILHQCIVLAVGMAGGAKRESTRLMGYDPDAITRSTFLSMVGQALCYLSILVVPVIFMFHYVPLMFRFPMEGDFLQVVMFLLPMCLAAIGIGFCFQAIVIERESVFVSWVITSLVFLLLSGLIWPQCDMYGVWRWLSSICPSSWGVQGFVLMETNGASLSQVSHYYINLWLCAAGWWLLGWAAQKWSVRPAIMIARGIPVKRGRWGIRRADEAQVRDELSGVTE